MTDRPMIFSAPMVRALLAGRKKQTRRIVMKGVDQEAIEPPYFVPEWNLWVWRDGETAHRVTNYQSGDQLYVREHWKTLGKHDCRAPRSLGPLWRASIWGREDGCPVAYLADDARRGQWPDDDEVPVWRPGKHRQGMHMPRWASRLTLTVEQVRVEPLQAISEADVLAEGAPLDPNHRDGTQDGSNPVMCVGDRPWTSQSLHAWYHRLWDSLHTKPGERWEDNPMVVALTFSVEQRNIDQVAP